jgi:6-pyruvoyltetrahydropterin/6-carboxytetrahydropterin synthase
MFELRVEIDFPAAHHLVGYPGDCARPHGHNWKVEVFMRTAELDSVGMAVDFRVLKEALRKIIIPWDHQDLNQLIDFKRVNPTAEWIAKIIFEKLTQAFNTCTASVDRVTVWENERCSATYFK